MAAFALRREMLKCFPEEATFIEPDNQFAIMHTDIMVANRKGEFANHTLPADFEARLCAAIKNCITLSAFQKDRFKEFVKCG